MDSFVELNSVCTASSILVYSISLPQCHLAVIFVAIFYPTMLQCTVKQLLPFSLEVLAF